MDAAADYHAVRDVFVNQKLPAYVSYMVRSHAGFDAIGGDDRAKVVVRTSDGKIVAGKPPKIQFDGDHSIDSDLLAHGPFKPACYEGSSATPTTFDHQPVEAIVLHSVCPESAHHDHTDNTDFTTLYVDPATHRPIAVVGGNDEQYVSAHIDERFAVFDGYVVPSAFSVRIAGSGPMFWLNVDARETLSDYRFMSTLP